MEIKTNRLNTSNSLYLQQHADDPVHWQPWSDCILEQAKQENKLIFVSIGYSACHWCHVMAHESFRNNDIAQYLNDYYISIKIDREEHPHIDKLFMMSCQLLSNQSGWPLSIFLLPNGQPIYAGTYFPPESQYNRIGFKDILIKLQSIWLSEPNKLLQSGENLYTHIQEYINSQATLTNNNISQDNKLDLIHKAATVLHQSFDNKYGGFSQAPKFPTIHNLQYLLNYGYSFKCKKSINQVLQTLDYLQTSGIHDNINGGWHRYTIDQAWHSPHFEKMLYDQALNTQIYIKAYQLTHNTHYKDIAQKTLDFVNQAMRTPEHNAYYSAMNADSNHIEGEYYLWKYNELQESLSADELEFLIKYCNISSKGNYHDGISQESSYLNIICRFKEFSSEELYKDWHNICKKLQNIRQHKELPDIDKKILTDWNSLIIISLVQAGITFKNTEYINNAINTCQYILDNYLDDNNLLAHCQGQPNGGLEDYAFFIQALLELYQATGIYKYLDLSCQLTDKAIELFWDNNIGGFYLASENNTHNIFIRSKEIHDSAIASGNAYMLKNLFTLNNIFLDKYSDIINSLCAVFHNTISHNPEYFTGFLYTYINLFNFPSHTILINDKDKEFAQHINQVYLPNNIIIYPDDNIELTHSKEAFLNKPTMYFCHDKSCDIPVYTHEDLQNKLQQYIITI